MINKIFLGFILMFSSFCIAGSKLDVPSAETILSIGMSDPDYSAVLSVTVDKNNFLTGLRVENDDQTVMNVDFSALHLGVVLLEYSHQNGKTTPLLKLQSHDIDPTTGGTLNFIYLPLLLKPGAYRTTTVTLERNQVGKWYLTSPDDNAHEVLKYAILIPNKLQDLFLGIGDILVCGKQQCP